MDLNYYSEYQEAARSHWWFRGRERVVTSVVQAFVPDADAHVVADLGSGPGGPARAIFPLGRIVALDLSPLPLRANSQADDHVVGDVVRLPYRTGSVGAICAFDILEHVDDDVAALQEWHRVLARGGLLFLTVPAYPQLWSSHDEANGHRRRYVRRTLQELLPAAGFVVRHLTYYNTLLLPGIALVRWTQRLVHVRRRPKPAGGSGELDFGWRLPHWLERCCEEALTLESRWLRRHALPIGLSLCAVAQSQETP